MSSENRFFYLAFCIGLAFSGVSKACFTDAQCGSGQVCIDHKCGYRLTPVSPSQPFPPGAEQECLAIRSSLQTSGAQVTLSLRGVNIADATDEKKVTEKLTLMAQLSTYYDCSSDTTHVIDCGESSTAVKISNGTKWQAQLTLDGKNCRYAQSTYPTLDWGLSISFEKVAPDSDVINELMLDLGLVPGSFTWKSDASLGSIFPGPDAYDFVEPWEPFVSGSDHRIGLAAGEGSKLYQVYVSDFPGLTFQTSGGKNESK